MNNIFNPSSTDLGDAAKELLYAQKKDWKLLADGSKSLQTIELKSFDFDNFSLKVQFNPGRIVSTGAKVDTKSIKERKCFLCPRNLPPEQKGILYREEYLLLCNPFPIFPEHFTIPGIEHKPQSITGAFGHMLDLSRDLSKYYIVFYNGPKCGASAPDHFHFQAGDKFFMPIDKDYDNLIHKCSFPVFENSGIKITAIDDSLRKMISFECGNKELLESSLNKFMDCYQSFTEATEEAMMNVLAFHNEGLWRIIIMLREKHRSSHYFREGDDKIMLSPASVDLGGVCITPLEKDFKKIDTNTLKEIFTEVFISRQKLENLASRLKKIF